MIFSYMIFLHAGLAVIFCVLCSYTDIKFRKIRNIHIIFMILIGIYAQAIYYYFDLVSYKTCLTLVLGGAVLSFLLYYWGIWAPGDAKLCFACMLLLPPIGSISSAVSTMTYMPIVLLINIFLPSLLFVVVLALMRTTTKQKIAALSSLLENNAENLKNSVLMIPLMLIVFVVTRQALNSTLAPILHALELPSYLFSLLYLSFSLFFTRKIFAEIQQKKSKKHTIIWVMSSSLIALGLAFFIPISMVLISFGFLLTFGILHTVLTSLLHTIFTDEVSIMELQEHSIPIVQITREEDKNGKVEYKAVSPKVQVSPENILLPSTTTGIPRDTLETVKRLCEEGAFEDFSNAIKVCRPLHFAPVIGFGVILTLLCQGPFYIKGLQLFT